MNSSLENTASRNKRMDVRLLLDLEVNTVDGLRDHYKFSGSENSKYFWANGIFIRNSKSSKTCRCIKLGQTWPNLAR